MMGRLIRLMGIILVLDVLLMPERSILTMRTKKLISYYPK